MSSRILFVSLLYVSLKAFQSVYFFTQVPSSVDPTFLVEVADFTKFASTQQMGALEQNRLNNISVKFGPTKSLSPFPLVGVCHYQINEVWVDEGYWNTASSEQRQDLIDHELGHCILGRVHRHSEDGHGHKTSMMAPSLFPTERDLFGNNKLRHELFNPDLYHKLPSLQEQMYTFNLLNSPLVPYMTVGAYEFSRIFEDELNGDSDSEVKEEQIKGVVNHARETYTRWSKYQEKVLKDGRRVEDISIFERQQVLMGNL